MSTSCTPIDVFYSVNELLKLKEELTKERDEQLSEIVKLRESLNDAQNRQTNMDQQQSEANQKIQEVGRQAVQYLVVLLL